MSIEINPENRNFNRGARTCSFCRRAGHNILSCNSQPLRNFELMCVNNITSTNDINIEQSFRNFLLSEALYDSNMVKSFAARYCRISARNNIDICIESIIQYFNPFIEIRKRELNEINQNFTRADETSQEATSQEPELAQQNEISSANILRELESIRDIPLQIRQFINNPRNVTENDHMTLIMSMMFLEMVTELNNSNINKKFDIKTNICDNKDDLYEKSECNICYDEYQNLNFINLNCGHKFCKDCIKKSLQNEVKQNLCCAFCRTEIKNFEFKEESIKNEFIELINEC
jgi:hypothetical protein